MSSDDPLVEYAGISASDLRAVLNLVAGTDVVELDVRFGAGRVSLRRPPVMADATGPPPDGIATSEVPPVLAIASTLVGIFRPTVSVGDAVEHGQSIGTIEALGMPTSVAAPHSGTVTDMLVSDGSPVGYGQPLLVLRRDALET